MTLSQKKLISFFFVCFFQGVLLFGIDILFFFFLLIAKTDRKNDLFKYILPFQK